MFSLWQLGLASVARDAVRVDPADVAGSWAKGIPCFEGLEDEGTAGQGVLGWRGSEPEAFWWLLRPRSSRHPRHQPSRFSMRAEK